MKHLLDTSNTILIFVLTILALVSCSSSRRTDGFQYRPVVKAPNIASGNIALNAQKKVASLDWEKVEYKISPDEIDAINSIADKLPVKLAIAEREKMNKISDALIQEYRTRIENGTPTTNRELVNDVTKNLVKGGTIEQLSRKDIKRLDRLAVKLDKKLQKEGKDIDVKNNTNLELFFLIMGIAGLVLGILGVWIGWLLFVVFGGLYLYYKLVKD